MRIAIAFAVVVLSVTAQPNLAVTNRLETISKTQVETIQTPTNQEVSAAQPIEKAREDCIQNRRQICGKILKILPDGLVIGSGYTNLSRYPLNRSWLVPGTAAAARPANVVEGNEPDTICIGLVFLTDLPRTPGPGPKPKPRLYDYVNLEAYSTGQYTYTSVRDVRRTVRKFSASLGKAVQWKLQVGEK